MPNTDGVPLTIVDAFTDRAFAGNPAGGLPARPVARDAAGCRGRRGDEPVRDGVPRRPRGDGYFDLRWFTPTVEVDLCGHATLARPTSSTSPAR